MTKHPDHGPVWETPNAVGANVHFSSLDLEWHRMRLVEVTQWVLASGSADFRNPLPSQPG